MSSLFGYLALVGAVYCGYAYYKLKVKKEITSALMSTKNTNMKKCKDYNAYCKAMEAPLLILTISLFACGLTDFYTANTGKGQMLSLFMSPIVIICILYYGSCNKKANEKFF